MPGRRWDPDRLVLAVQVVAGLVVAVLFLRLGLSAWGPDRTPLDRAFPFAVAGLAVLVTAWTVVRSRRTRPPAPPPAGRPPAPAAPPAGPAGTAPAGAPPAAPKLSPSGRAALGRILGVLAGAGMFAPRVPAPDELAEAVADHGEPVTAFAVLQALHEAEYHHPGFRFEEHTARLAFHADQTEQTTEYLHAQVRDLDRLAGDTVTVAASGIEVGWTDGRRVAPTRLRLVVDGRARTLTYDGAVKALSTVLHVAVAGAVREAGAPVRLAALASDAGTWIAALPAGTDLDRLDADLGAPPTSGGSGSTRSSRGPRARRGRAPGDPAQLPSYPVTRAARLRAPCATRRSGRGAGSGHGPTGTSTRSAGSNPAG